MDHSTRPAPLSVRRRWTVLAICSLSLFAVGLDTTIVNVALPAIGQAFAVSTRELEWTVDAYTLVLASLLITSGALADRFGRRRVFQIGLTVFGSASVACALAPSIGFLVAARAVQGVGGSMLSPVALAIVVNVITDPRERARAIGVWGGVFGASIAAGPVVGGALLAALDWRSVFWLNAPVTAAAVLLTALLVPESRSDRPRRLDAPGQLLLVIIVGGSVASLIEGPHIGWTSTLAVAGYLTVAAAVAAFVVVESRRRAPLMELSLFRRPPFAAAVVGAVVAFVALNATLLLNTLYLQHARGMSALATGVVTLPLTVAATLCAPLSGYLVGRVGPRLPMRLAGVFIAAGGLLLVPLRQHSPIWLLLGAYLLIGVGFGFANAPITNTAVSGLPPDRAGVAGGTTSAARQFGSALGIAAAGSTVATAPVQLFAQASRPAWALVAACGAVLLLLATASPGRGRAGRGRAGRGRQGRGPSAARAAGPGVSAAVPAAAPPGRSSPPPQR